MNWMGVVASAMVSLAVFTLGFLVSGGFPGWVVRRARRRQDLLDMLEKQPDAATAEQTQDLRDEQLDDLRQIVAERERIAALDPGKLFAIRYLFALLYPGSMRLRAVWGGMWTLWAAGWAVLCVYGVRLFEELSPGHPYSLGGWPRWPLVAAGVTIGLLATASILYGLVEIVVGFGRAADRAAAATEPETRAGQ